MKRLKNYPHPYKDKQTPLAPFQMIDGHHFGGAHRCTICPLELGFFMLGLRLHDETQKPSNDEYTKPFIRIAQKNYRLLTVELFTNRVVRS